LGREKGNGGKSGKIFRRSEGDLSASWRKIGTGREDVCIAKHKLERERKEKKKSTSKSADYQPPRKT